MGRWSRGRPVFRKVGTDPKFLLVSAGVSEWVIQSSTTSPGAFIISGRATNSPTSPEAGPTVRTGRNGWAYNHTGFSIEGDISVTCA